jgi:hypothetical protein
MIEAFLSVLAFIRDCVVAVMMAWVGLQAVERVAPAQARAQPVAVLSPVALKTANTDQAKSCPETIRDQANPDGASPGANGTGRAQR